jgi:hypothetical protein
MERGSNLLSSASEKDITRAILSSSKPNEAFQPYVLENELLLL